jgi:hypothetical protein
MLLSVFVTFRAFDISGVAFWGQETTEVAMDKRVLRIVKSHAPAVAVCECCNAQFKSIYPEESAVDIAVEFLSHECEPMDRAKSNLFLPNGTTTRFPPVVSQRY